VDELLAIHFAKATITGLVLQLHVVYIYVKILLPPLAFFHHVTVHDCFAV